MEAQEGRDLCKLVADSHCCMAETNRTLQSNYHPIKRILREKRNSKANVCGVLQAREIVVRYQDKRIFVGDSVRRRWWYTVNHLPAVTIRAMLRYPWIIPLPFFFYCVCVCVCVCVFVSKILMFKLLKFIPGELLLCFWGPYSHTQNATSAYELCLPKEVND